VVLLNLSWCVIIVFKINRYAPDYPGLAGKDLIPKGTITDILGSA